MDFSRYAGQEEDRAVLRTITDEVMAALATLSGQEYVDEYAAVVKERTAAEQRARISAATKARIEEARAGVEHAREHMRDRTASVAEQLSERLAKDDEATKGTSADSAAAEITPGDHPAQGDATR